MNFLKKYWAKQKQKSWWSWTTDILFVLLFAGLLIPSTRVPIMVFIKELTNFSPSVSAEDSYGQLKAKDYHWKFLDTGSQEKQLKDYSDKPILINMWATWCPPCIAEMPSFQKLQDDYGNQVHFLFISNENQSTTRLFLQEKSWDFDSYRPLGPSPDLLMSTSLPTTFIIDKNGVIVVKETGNKNWDSKGVRELLDQLILKAHY